MQFIPVISKLNFRIHSGNKFVLKIWSNRHTHTQPHTTHTHNCWLFTHTHTHTDTCWLFTHIAQIHSPTLTLTHTHSPHTHTHTQHTHTLTHSHTLSHTRTHTHTHTTHTLTHTHTHTHTHTLTHTHTDTRWLFTHTAQIHTHTHTHARTLTHTHTHSCWSFTNTSTIKNCSISTEWNPLVSKAVFFCGDYVPLIDSSGVLTLDSSLCVQESGPESQSVRQTQSLQERVSDRSHRVERRTRERGARARVWPRKQPLGEETLTSLTNQTQRSFSLDTHFRTLLLLLATVILFCLNSFL